MNNIQHKKLWATGTNPAHVEPPPIPLMKETTTGKPDGDYVKLKLRIYPTFSTLDLYGFRMSLFDHGETEEFLSFICNFQMNLAATGTLDTEAQVQYLSKIFLGEVLRQFYLMYYDAENTDTSLNMDDLLKGLAWYFFL